MNRERGFTIVELLFAAPVFILAIAAMVSFLVSIHGQMLVKDSQVTMALQSQTALSSIQDDLFFARNFAEEPNAVMVDAHEPSGGWTHNTSPNNTLVVYQIALDESYQSSGRDIIYQGAAPCDDTEAPVLVNLIYYIDGADQLRRRVLVPDPVNERCAEPFLTQTCPTAGTRDEVQPGGTVSTVPCPADAVLAEGVASFTVDYYDANGTLLDFGAGDSPLQGERVTLHLDLERTVQGRVITHEADLSIKKVNSGDPNIQ